MKSPYELLKSFVVTTRRRSSLRNRTTVIPAIVLMVMLPSFAAAQSVDLAHRPYNVHFVLLLSEHRFLNSEHFQNQFPRDLAQQVKLLLGPLVDVATTRSHPLAETIRRDGLDAAIDAHEELSIRRTW